MSSNETTTTLEAMSAAVRAAAKFSHDQETSEELTPAMLAGAIKLAALSTSHQEQLTSATVNAAIKLTAKVSDQQQHDDLTLESLATALKLAVKASANENNEKDNDEVLADQMLAAKKQAEELVTPELLSDAIELAKK